MMKLDLHLGRYKARFAQGQTDMAAALALRGRVFRGRTAQARDTDRFDETYHHVLIEDRSSGTLVCCFRVLPFFDGDAAAQSYSGQYYDLASLAAYPGPLMELGRFCIDPDKRDGDILRVAWAAMTRLVDDLEVAVLFGCASFDGVDPGPYADALALLADRHLAPDRWRPGVKSPHVVAYGSEQGDAPDLKRAQANLPPLLRTYLMMGGWVSDHAVIDYDLGTLHVLTCVEISAVPPSRARLLRLLAKDDGGEAGASDADLKARP